MAMHLFYLPGIEGDTAILSEEDSHHALRVLRLKENSTLFITNGNGGLHECRIEGMHPKQCQVRIIKTNPEFQKRDFYLHIAIAPTKSIDRFEWFLEKSTEIGIDEVTPLICQHSERTTLKTDRLKKVMISAMKQSLKAYLPKLNQPVRYNDFIKQSFEGQKFIAYIDKDATLNLKDYYRKGAKALIMIGPEGDFSKEEINSVRDEGFIPVSLGNSRLRTETAGIVTCCLVNLING